MLRGEGLVMSGDSIHPDKKAVEKRCPLYDSPNKIMHLSLFLIERAYVNTGRTVHAILGPERVTLFWIDVPF